MRLFKIAWLSPVIFLLLTGCRKPTGANWDVDVVLPVVNSTLNIKNFIGDSVFQSDNNGVLNLIINREITSIKLDSLLNIPDTVIKPDPFYSPVNILLNPGDQLTFFPATELKFSIGNGIEIRRADIRKCVMKVKFSSNVPQPLDLVYSIPSAKKNGQPFTITETVPTGTNSLVKDYDLSGYSLDMRGLNGKVYNTIVQTYVVKVNPNASAVTVNAGQGVSIEVSYSQIVPEYVEGYFGKQEVNIAADTASISFINNVKASNFMLSDATLNFRIVNEFGAEFSGNLSNIKSINTQQNSIIAINSNQLSNINVNAANRVGNTIYPTTKPIGLNSANSNVAAFISNLPDKLTYQGKIKLNPNTDNSISGHNDFAFYNTGVKIMADITIPMRFTANYFQLVSNAEIDLANLSQLDAVNSGNFVISASNGYPFDARLQAYLLDSQGQVQDSLFINGSNTILKGQLDSQNDVTAPTRSRILIPITQSKIDKLRKSRAVRIVSNFLMPPNPPEIRIKESYQFDVNIIAELNYNVGVRN